MCTCVLFATPAVSGLIYSRNFPDVIFIYLQPGFQSCIHEASVWLSAPDQRPLLFGAWAASNAVRSCSKPHERVIRILSALGFHIYLTLTHTVLLSLTTSSASRSLAAIASNMVQPVSRSPRLWGHTQESAVLKLTARLRYGTSWVKYPEGSQETVLDQLTAKHWTSTWSPPGCFRKLSYVPNHFWSVTGWQQTWKPQVHCLDWIL